jgi:hypothetical protein
VSTVSAFYAFAGGFDAAGIPYTPAPAGMFLWVDLRAAFGNKQATWQDEEALWNCMVQQHRVVLTPGECNEPMSCNGPSCLSLAKG